MAVDKVGFLYALLALFLGCTSLTPIGSERVRAEKETTTVGLETDVLGAYWQERAAFESPLAPPYIAVMPFRDESGFRPDVWKVGTGLASLLSGEMNAISAWQVVPYEVVEKVLGDKKSLGEAAALAMGRELRADIVLTGVVEDYDMRRLSVGDPLLGGYKSYSGIAQLRVWGWRVSDGSALGEIEVSRELVDRDLGLDLLGKPRSQDENFTGLKGVVYGSELFRKTLIGRATLEAVDVVLVQMVDWMRPEGVSLGESPEILSLYGSDVYVNIGSENGLHSGFRFAVFPAAERVRTTGVAAAERVGVVEVIEIIGARLSSVRILEGGGAILPGDRLKLVDVLDSETTREKE